MANSRTATKEKDETVALEEQQTAGALTDPAASALQAYDFGEDTGAGQEQMRIEGMLTPFINIIQPTSAQLKPGKAEYIPDAKMGMFLNTATGRLYSGEEGIEVMPVWMEYLYTEWIPVDDGGGFRGTHDPDSELIQNLLREAGDKGRFQKLEWTNDAGEHVELIEQWNVAVIYGSPKIEEGTMRRGLLPFTSTKLGQYKAWMAAISDITYPNPRTGKHAAPPMWAHRWKVNTTMRTNKKGDWFVYKIGLAEPGDSRLSLVPPNDLVYIEAKKFRDLWRGGQVKADYKSAETAMGAENSSQGAGIDTKDENIPF